MKCLALSIVIAILLVSSSGCLDFFQDEQPEEEEEETTTDIGDATDSDFLKDWDYGTRVANWTEGEGYGFRENNGTHFVNEMPGTLNSFQFDMTGDGFGVIYFFQGLEYSTNAGGADIDSLVQSFESVIAVGFGKVGSMGMVSAWSGGPGTGASLRYDPGDLIGDWDGTNSSSLDNWTQLAQYYAEDLFYGLSTGTSISGGIDASGLLWFIMGNTRSYLEIEVPPDMRIADTPILDFIISLFSPGGPSRTEPNYNPCEPHPEDGWFVDKIYNRIKCFFSSLDLSTDFTNNNGFMTGFSLTNNN